MDPATFRRSLRSIVAMVGLLMQEGIIPTGVDYGGKYGTLLVALAFLIRGSRYDEPPRRMHRAAGDRLE